VREEATAPIAAAAAATKNNEQKIRRNCDGTNLRFELLVIGLFYAAPLARRRVDWI
jgi:hypothetical protein